TARSEALIERAVGGASEARTRQQHFCEIDRTDRIAIQDLRYATNLLSNTRVIRTYITYHRCDSPLIYQTYESCMLRRIFRQQPSHRLPFSPSGQLQWVLAFGVHHVDLGTMLEKKSRHLMQPKA